MEAMFLLCIIHTTPQFVSIFCVIVNMIFTLEYIFKRWKHLIDAKTKFIPVTIIIQLTLEKLYMKISKSNKEFRYQKRSN